MAIVDKWDYTPLTMEDDPDDYRPDSKLALIIDPAQSPEGFVQGLTVFDERIAPGDRIPFISTPSRKSCSWTKGTSA